MITHFGYQFSSRLFSYKNWKMSSGSICAWIAGAFIVAIITLFHIWVKYCVTTNSEISNAVVWLTAHCSLWVMNNISVIIIIYGAYYEIYR